MRARNEPAGKTRVGMWPQIFLLGLLVCAAAGCSNGGETNDEGKGGATNGEGAIGFCDVDPILEAKCRRCHGDPTIHGAPFSLVGFESLDAEYPAGSGTPLPEAMVRAIESDFMPYRSSLIDPPVQDLTAEEETLLVSWLKAGAPRGTPTCD